MSSPPPVSTDPGTDGCADLRAAVATLCEQAQHSGEARDLAAERLRELRRDLVTAERKRATTEAAADPSLRAAGKAKARQAYERAMATAQGSDAIMEATASWARAIDRINRSGRLADRAVR